MDGSLCIDLGVDSLVEAAVSDSIAPTSLANVRYETCFTANIALSVTEPSNDELLSDTKTDGG
jgi:hypothetical protein